MKIEQSQKHKQQQKQNEVMDVSSFDYSRLDNAIAQFLMSRCAFDKEHQAEQRNTFRDIVRELSAALAKGHSCIAVSDDQQRLLKESALIYEVDDTSLTDVVRTNTPLILENSRLYLQRYWHYETRLAEQLRYKISNNPQHHNNLEKLLDKYFEIQTEKDWQREAAMKVSQQSFSIITGGPGTGKTTTVLKILALLQEIQLTQVSPAGTKPLNIALAAPTGKAAMRLQESIGEGKEKLNCSDEIKASITDSVSTIHRLLGAKPASPYFKHHADNPLVYDVVVIDEASMVDLALMSKLVDALQPDARLILLGDKEQLASVESGAILGDLSQGLPDNTIELKKSWRFKAEIKNLALAINQQNAQLAWQLLVSDHASSTALVTTALLPHIMHHTKNYFEIVNKNNAIEEIFKAYRTFQILCSNRRGKWGVEGINASIERALQQQGVNTSQRWYAGKPVIITRNDPGLGLFNGDIGICLFDDEEMGNEQRERKGQKDLLVYFQLADGRIKKLLPARLPQHETAYALTIHKSQGSEFKHILMVLPETPNPVLGKELVYTAITRAKETVEVFSSENVFSYALSRKVVRISGLQDKVRPLHERNDE